MKKDLKKTINETAKFLGKSLTPEQTVELERHLSFENFQNNKSVNISALKDLGFFGMNSGDNFVRKGKSGGWREYFSCEEAKEVEEWVRKNQEAINISFSI